MSLKGDPGLGGSFSKKIETFPSSKLSNPPSPRYINTWGMVLIGMLECFAVGWVYKIDRQYQKVGQVSVLIYNVGFFIALFLGTVLAISLPVKPDDDTDAITTEANAVRIENS